MNKNILIDTLRTINKTKTKFISLFAIVMLGTSFFVGISSVAPIMSESVDVYNDQYNLRDIEIFSNYGFSESNLLSANQLEGVELAEGRYFIDGFLVQKDKNVVTRLIGYNSQSQINSINLIEGTYPQNNQECLVGVSNVELNVNFNLGDDLQFEMSGEDINEWIEESKCKVVGLIQTPEFLDISNGPSTLSNQEIGYYVFMTENNFKAEAYSSLLILLENAKSLDSFKEKYKDQAELMVVKLEELGEVEASQRRDEVVQEATKEYEDGQKEYEDAKKEAEEELAKNEQDLIDGEVKLAESKKEISDGKKAIAEAKKVLEDKLQEGYDKLNSTQEIVDVNTKEFEKAKSEYYYVTKPALITQKAELNQQLTPLKYAKQGLATIEESRIQVDTQNQQLQARKTDLEALTTLTPQEQQELAEINATMLQLNATLAQLNNQKTIILENLSSSGIANEQVLEQSIAQLQQGIDAIDSGISSAEYEIAANGQKLKEASKQIEIGYIELEWQISEARKELVKKEKEIAAGERKLITAEKELKEGRKEFEEAKIEVEQKLKDAKQELTDAKIKIDELSQAEWIVLSREKHFSSATYNDTISQMKAIAAVFPLFFMLVAALICSTTMTRMVDEQRGQLGTLRSLGYSKLACMSKYLFYALLATITGAIAGIFAGLFIFPPVIYGAWGMMYNLPPLKTVVVVPMILAATGSFVILMIVVTYLSARTAMKEVTSQLLRPKPPTAGKRQWLEKVTFIWNRLSFTSKVTLRNIFRYKKRFFMTVLGIGGCTALLITGFGLQSSLNFTHSREFEELYRYDGYVQLEKDLTKQEKEQVLKDMLALETIEKTMLISSFPSIIQDGAQELSATVLVFENGEEAAKIRDLIGRKSKKEIQLGNEGLLINEKLSILLGVSVGDTILIENGDGRFEKMAVSGIFESYIGNNVYVTQKYYEEIFGRQREKDSVFIKAAGAIDQQQLADIEHVKSLQLYDSLSRSISSILDGMKSVIYIIILCAALLAFIVLGNLTSVNISERQREIATLKVLGFRRNEVNSYIFKENLLLVFFGILLGFVLGRLLHLYVILLVEMDNVMFGRNIPWNVYLVSAMLTFIFAIIVNVVISFTLRKIQMVESLKSIE